MESCLASAVNFVKNSKKYHASHAFALVSTYYCRSCQSSSLYLWQLNSDAFSFFDYVTGIIFSITDKITF